MSSANFLTIALKHFILQVTVSKMSGSDPVKLGTMKLEKTKVINMHCLQAASVALLSADDMMR